LVKFLRFIDDIVIVFPIISVSKFLEIGIDPRDPKDAKSGAGRV
jgi:hypothetical protein